jgi:hypothetical protein
MLTSIWNNGLAFFSVLRYHLYSLILFIVPSFFKAHLPNRENPDVVECCRGPVNGKQSPSTADDTRATSITECPDTIKIEKEDPLLYEPPLGEILGEGSTSRIARVAPGVIIKCPRFSWWHSKSAADTWFVRDMKRSFEVEERLLQILGLHPRIIESVSP